MRSNPEIRKRVRTHVTHPNILILLPVGERVAVRLTDWPLVQPGDGMAVLWVMWPCDKEDACPMMWCARVRRFHLMPYGIISRVRQITERAT